MQASNEVICTVDTAAVELLLGVVPAAALLLSLDDGRIRNVNDSFLRLVGHAREELIGHTVTEKGVVAETPFRETVVAQLRSRRSVRNLELTIEPREREQCPVLVSADLVEYQGDVCALAVFVDISENGRIAAGLAREYKQAEAELEQHRFNLSRLVEKRTAELRRSRRRLAAAIDATGGGIYEHAVPLRADTYLSDRWAEILGYTKTELPPPAEFAGWVRERVHPDDVTGYDKAYDDFVEGRTPGYRKEIRIRHKSGEWRYVEDYSYAVSRDVDGVVKRVVGVMLDVTERKRLEEQLLHSQKMEAMGLLAGGIAHDFNNMMQVVTGFSHRTLRQLALDNPIRENIERIHEAAKSAAGLTHQLLAFSRKQLLKPSVLSINELITRMKRILRRSLGENIALTCELQRDLGRVKADPVQLENIILNMALNARHAMPQGGKLVLRTEDVVFSGDAPFDDAVPPGPYVMTAISDTGCGMDETVMKRIFEPFFTTQPAGQGSGLGLSMAYGTIRQSGGAIRVYSEPGKGTTFKIYLPRTDEPVSPKRSRIPELVVPNGEQTVLVVEDNSLALEFTCQELQDLGYRVLQARSDHEAFGVSRTYQGSIHLLLTDVVLPGQSGWEIAGVLCAERPDMAVLYMSGYDETQIVERNNIQPNVRLLPKPFSPDELASAVAEALSTRGTESAQTHVQEINREQEPGASDKKEHGCIRVLMVDDDEGTAAAIGLLIEDDGHTVAWAADGTSALSMVQSYRPELV
ncbi:MAG: PAS domain S-box protein, partial [Chitinivibrionales bacterium]|nr:PAS domain S-box protein [Chitinivibrionales bacterium]